MVGGVAGGGQRLVFLVAGAQVVDERLALDLVALRDHRGAKALGFRFQLVQPGLHGLEGFQVDGRRVIGRGLRFFVFHGNILLRGLRFDGANPRVGMNRGSTDGNFFKRYLLEQPLTAGQRDISPIVKADGKAGDRAIPKVAVRRFRRGDALDEKAPFDFQSLLGLGETFPDTDGGGFVVFQTDRQGVGNDERARLDNIAGAVRAAEGPCDAGDLADFGNRKLRLVGGDLVGGLELDFAHAATSSAWTPFHRASSTSKATGKISDSGRLTA